MKKPDIYQVSIFAGMVLLLLGLQLRLVDSYVLTPAATRMLARISGPAPDSPEGTLRQVMIESTSPRQEVRPWPWLGWASLSTGGVLTAFGAMHKWRKH
jgi:hypothetical protein